MEIEKIRERLAQEESKRQDEIYAPDWQLAEIRYKEGRPRGKSSGIAPMDTNFSWKKGFIQCFTGWPNFGKTELTMQLMLIMSILNGWKWVIWTPEMMDSFSGRLTANDVFDMMAHAMLGKNPDKHYHNQPTLDEYREAYRFLGEHFRVIYPHKRTAHGVLDMFVRLKDSFDFDGVLLDPFKSLHHETNERWDIYLERTFDSFKSFATEGNIVFNLIAHPNSFEGAKLKDKTGETIGIKVCDQFMLSGGSAWNNTMDGIFAIHRPNYHIDFQDPAVQFFAHKIRKQNLVGRTGVVDNISFNIAENRYYFDGSTPLNPKPIVYESNKIMQPSTAPW